MWHLPDRYSEIRYNMGSAGAFYSVHRNLLSSARFCQMQDLVIILWMAKPIYGLWVLRKITYLCQNWDRIARSITRPMFSVAEGNDLSLYPHVRHWPSWMRLMRWKSASPCLFQMTDQGIMSWIDLALSLQSQPQCNSCICNPWNKL